MNFNAVDWSAIFGYIAGGGLTAVFALGGPRWAAIGLPVIAVAGLLRVAFNKTGAPATAIVADAAVVSPTTGNQIATNISSTSTLLKG